MRFVARFFAGRSYFHFTESLIVGFAMGETISIKRDIAFGLSGFLW